MLKINGLMAMMVLLFIGCRANADTEEPVDMTPVEESEITLEEQESSKDKEKKMQLTLENTTYSFVYKDYPILSQYVHNFDQPEEQLRRLPFSKIKKDQYRVEFACHEERCSHLMIDFNKKDSYLMSDLSRLVSTHVSPDQHFVAFIYQRDHDGEHRHQLIVMDLDTLEPVELEPNGDHLIPKPNQYQYAIHSVTFMDEEKLQITSDDPMADPSVEEPVHSLWIYQ
ncbi:hypothetical protein [Halobacillus karajensis]|uniref:Lipoprotein n=1 Tax=Halobacillus karajensis TaxID=195088 RepID=A0A024P3J2_9BACI|nr:hypothetical protein [Halobacillus karajensis]CDQ19986.1 hypothetical protein BN982_02293 [Halobacillus karajensis]CDQ22446.1 hypothetical protein BN983_00654 [Halobacillus karajensis]CDQ28289.1 hypothetical protein BN981_02583 [Halobacillus karajensis]